MPLKGLQVVELSGITSSFCGMLLADFGAHVIRVDQASGERRDYLGNGKISIALNFHKPEGAEVFRRLISRSDILIESFRKGLMEKWGLGPQVLQAENPKLIYARLTGYGQHGKYSSQAGHDINFLSMSGMLSLIGRSGEKPIPPANMIASFGGGGLVGTLGILMALLERSKSGRGQVVDISITEGTAYMGSWIYRTQPLGLWDNPRGHNLFDTGSHFYETYETRDGKFMAVGVVEPKIYNRLLKALDLSEKDIPQYVADFSQAKRIFTEKFKTKTQEEWCHIFDKIDVCVTPVLSLEETTIHPHHVERQSFTDFSETGIKIPCPAPVLSRTPGLSKATYASPSVGEHTMEILSNLNYNDEEIKGLIKGGIINVSETHSKL